MRIFLLGFMGVGKSTLGKIVASDLGFPFLDFDTIIESAMEMSISRIFEEYGEPFFRKLEHDHLRELIAVSDLFVVGTGGGLPCNSDNMSIMKGAGLTVYLSAPTKDIADRLSESTGSRPLIAGKTHEELEAYVEALLSTRSATYEEADLAVDLVLSKSKHFNADLIVKSIRAYMDLRTDA